MQIYLENNKILYENVREFYKFHVKKRNSA